MPIQLSITPRGPVESETNIIDVAESREYIPGETVEQLVSRLLYQCSCLHKTLDFKFRPISWANEQVIEIKLIRKEG